MHFTIALASVIGLSFAWPTTHSHQHLHRRSASWEPVNWTMPAKTGASLNQTGPGNGTQNQPTGLSWLPAGEKVRGVNLGSHFIIEPWMAWDEFNKMGCGQKNDEWQCVESLGQEKADQVFAEHWDTWTTQQDIANISAWGLNVVRIPVGFWLKEDLVHADEFYPRGGLPYFDRLMGWIADAGLYAIIDLHGAPGSQYPNQQFTGHSMSTPGFYTAENYERATTFLEWMTHRIHTNRNYRTAGILQIMNEPVHADDQYSQQAADMIENFYPMAYERIRAVESALQVPESQKLNIQYMGNAWGSGEPTSALPSGATNLLFDDHRYYKWDPSVEKTKDGYINAVCNDDREAGIIMGEWSIAVADDVGEQPTFAINQTGSALEEQKDWYRKYWAAQVEVFERAGGWVFWTYKCNWIGGKDEWRWCYQSAVLAGVIPEDMNTAGSLSPCH